MFMLNHYWDIGSSISLNTNIAYQTGTVANSRIDIGGSDLIQSSSGTSYLQGGGASAATNPVHPSNLPSYFLDASIPTSLDYQNAYLAQQKLEQDGQLDWDSLIETNQRNAAQGDNTTYILYDDVNQDQQLTANIILATKIYNHVELNAALNYKSVTSENYAEVTDLLGGTGFLDVDIYAFSRTGTTSELLTNAQSDLQQPNRIVTVGDRYDYNYIMNTSIIDGFIQGQFHFKRLDAFLSATTMKTEYQREGLFENGYFPGSLSLGKSNTAMFETFGLKAGGTLSINNHNYFNVNGGYFEKPPTLQNAFANARQNNITITELLGEPQEHEKVASIDASYIFRIPKLKAKLTSYYTEVKDATKLSFFFTQAISGSDTGFVQEILTDIDTSYLGGEFSLEYQCTPSVKLKGVAALGDFRYDNNPNLILTSTSDVFTNEQGVRDFGKTALKGYHLAVGPERAFQLGLEYRDPNFWWFSTTVNYFSNAYINISPFARTTNFYQDADGLPFNDYNEEVARTLLQQENFDDYFLVNLIAGKSWRIKQYTLGLFGSVNNVLNQEYRTGGFEQSRTANYRLALEESQRETPVFGSKYFYGYGTSYYLNMYLKF